MHSTRFTYAHTHKCTIIPQFLSVLFILNIHFLRTTHVVHNIYSDTLMLAWIYEKYHFIAWGTSTKIVSFTSILIVFCFLFDVWNLIFIDINTFYSIPFCARLNGWLRKVFHDVHTFFFSRPGQNSIPICICMRGRWIECKRNVNIHVFLPSVGRIISCDDMKLVESRWDVSMAAAERGKMAASICYEFCADVDQHFSFFVA